MLFLPLLSFLPPSKCYLQLKKHCGEHLSPYLATIMHGFYCTPENTVQFLIDTIYPGVSATQQSDQYYADHTIICSRNDDVHELNKKILDSFPGDEKVYFSADSIPTGKGNGDQGDLMYPVEYLNTIQCSGLSLAKLALKIGCPVMVLHNIDLSHGICNGTRGVVTRMQSCVIEIRLLTEEFKGKRAFVARLSLNPQDNSNPI